MDHLVPFVRSKTGNSYILGVIDGFTKFIFIKAVKNVKSKTTINVLKEIFNMIGVPKVIISDRGTSFTSSTFKTFIESIGVKHILNAVATPRANGQIERYNRTILESLAPSNHGMDEREWDTHIGKIQLSLNNTVNKSTGTSPSEIVFGRRMVGSNEGSVVNAIDDSVESVRDTETGNEDKIIESENYNRDALEQLDAVREKVRKQAQDTIGKNQDLMKRRYDESKAPTKLFRLGDLVMIPNHHNPADGKSKKLCPKFRGPFQITAVLEHDRYEVSSIKGHSKRKYKSIYPADQLKRWITFETTGHTDSENNSTSSDDNNVNSE